MYLLIHLINFLFIFGLYLSLLVVYLLYRFIMRLNTLFDQSNYLQQVFTIMNERVIVLIRQDLYVYIYYLSMIMVILYTLVLVVRIEISCNSFLFYLLTFKINFYVSFVIKNTFCYIYFSFSFYDLFSKNLIQCLFVDSMDYVFIEVINSRFRSIRFSFYLLLFLTFNVSSTEFYLISEFIFLFELLSYLLDVP